MRKLDRKIKEFSISPWAWKINEQSQIILGSENGETWKFIQN